MDATSLQTTKNKRLLKETKKHLDVFEVWYENQRHWEKTATKLQLRMQTLALWINAFNWRERADERDAKIAQERQTNCIKEKARIHLDIDEQLLSLVTKLNKLTNGLEQCFIDDEGNYEFRGRLEDEGTTNAIQFFLSSFDKHAKQIDIYCKKLGLYKPPVSPDYEKATRLNKASTQLFLFVHKQLHQQNQSLTFDDFPNDVEFAEKVRQILDKENIFLTESDLAQIKTNYNEMVRYYLET